MSEFITLEEIDRAAEAVHKRTSQKPTAALILGSGLGGLADSVQKADVISYEGIPGWPVPTVLGHKGRLVIGTLENTIQWVPATSRPL